MECPQLKLGGDRMSLRLSRCAKVHNRSLPLTYTRTQDVDPPQVPYLYLFSFLGGPSGGHNGDRRWQTPHSLLPCAKWMYKGGDICQKAAMYARVGSARQLDLLVKVTLFFTAVRGSTFVTDCDFALCRNENHEPGER